MRSCVKQNVMYDSSFMVHVHAERLAVLLQGDKARNISIGFILKIQGTRLPEAGAASSRRPLQRYSVPSVTSGNLIGCSAGRRLKVPNAATSAFVALCDVPGPAVLN